MPSEYEVGVILPPDIETVSVGIAGIQGPQGTAGPPGVSIGTAEPANTGVLWADTSEVGDAVVPAGGTAGQVLAKVSSSDYDTAWDTLTAADVGAYSSSNPSNFISAAGAPVQSVNGATGSVTVQAYVGGLNRLTSESSRYVSPGASLNGRGTRQVTSNRLYFTPWQVFESLTIDALVTVCTTGAASTGRIAVYAADIHFQPTGAPVIDAGTFDPTTSGVKTLTLASPVTLTTGRYVMLFAVSGGTPTFSRVHIYAPWQSAYLSSNDWSWDVNVYNGNGSAFVTSAPTNPSGYDTSAGNVVFFETLALARVTT